MNNVNLILPISLILFQCIYAMEYDAPSFTVNNNTSELVSQVKVNILYNPAIRTIPIEDFRNVRSFKQEKKDLLFQKMQEAFPLKTTIERIKNIKNPQIILWFTNYYGTIMQKTLEWYKDEVFSQCPQGTFWLTDLKAWLFFAVNRDDLLKVKKYSTLFEKIDQIQKTKGTDNSNNNNSEKQKLLLEECSFISDSSEILSKAANAMPSQYKILQSKEFFQWLLQSKNGALLNADICKKLFKETNNTDRLQFSLADIGFKSGLLSRDVKCNAKTVSMLEVNASSIYRILQYLEGIYYASKIIERAVHNKSKECSIIFMLPNKEFTYYMVPDEQEAFGCFKQGVQTVVNQIKDSSCVLDVSICFEPFAYKTDFYATPYKIDGTSIKNTASLLKRLGGTK